MLADEDIVLAEVIVPVETVLAVPARDPLCDNHSVSGLYV